MKTQFKKFIVALGLTPELTAFLENNKLSFAICNVVRHKTGAVEFDAVTDYHMVEKTILTKEEQPVWDLFHDFKTIKNGVAVLLHAIETGNAITNETYNQQSKITPKAELPKVKSFVQFWATLDQAQKTKAIEVANGWLKYNHIEETSFDFFFINGTKNLNLKEGDYLMGYDATYGQRMATRVLQASPSGFVTCVDDGGHFTLGNPFKAEVVAREQIPSEVADILDATFNELNTEASEQKTAKLEKALDIADRRAKQSGKIFEQLMETKLSTKGLLDRAKETMSKYSFDEEQAKALNDRFAEAEKAIKDGIEAVTKANEEKTKEFDRLMSLKLTTPDAIAKAVGDLNQAKLGKERTEQVRGKIKEAKEKLSTKAPENTPAPAGAETPKAEQKKPQRNAPKDNNPAKQFDEAEHSEIK